MPVEDHPIDPRTQKTGHRPGCWDRQPLAWGYWAMDGWTTREQFIPLHNAGMNISVAQPNMVKVKHNMSTDCRSDDPACTGCCNFKEV
jgi:hypothetical protein